MQPRSTHRRPAGFHSLRAGFLPLLAVLATAGGAFAADVPPTPDKGLALYSPVGGYALMALDTAVVISVSLLPSKRGHQD